MNHMKEVAKMLGVEMGEEFEIEGMYENPFRLTERGLYDCYGHMMPLVLHNLITGNYEIVEKPWVPKDGEMAWITGFGDNAMRTVFRNDYTSDVAMLALGWYFYTREDAEAHAPEIQEQMRRILAGELRAELVEARK